MSRRAWRDALAAAGVGLAALAVAMRALEPFGARFRDSLMPNLQDPLFNSYLLAWGSHQLALGLPDFWNAPFYFPEPRVVALSDHLVGPAALAWLLGRVGVGVLASCNLMVLASFPLAAVTVFALLRRAGLRAASAALGGWAYAFAPFRWMHLEHLPMLWLPALALALVAWDRLLERPAPGRAAAFVAAYAVHFSGGLYLAYMIHLPLAAIAWIRRAAWLPRLRDRKPLVSLLAATAAAAAIAGLTFLPYVEAARRGYHRTAGEMALWGATLASFVTPSRFDRYFPAGLDALYRWENALFPGVLVTLALAVLVLRRRRPELAIRRPLVVAAGLVVAGAAVVLADLATWTDRESVEVLGFALRIRGYSRPALLLALGALAVVAGVSRTAPPRPARGRRALRQALALQGALAAALCLPIVAAPLARLVPGLVGLRVPARFAALALLAGALAVAAVASLVARRLPRRHRGAAVLALGGLLLLPDLWTRPVVWSLVGEAGAPPVYRELARRELAGAVVELPFASGDLRSDLVRMWHSTAHWNPTSAGYSGYEPPRSRELRELATHATPRELVARFRALGFRFLVLHVGELASADPPAPAWREAVVAEGGRPLLEDRDALLFEIGSPEGSAP